MQAIDLILSEIKKDPENIIQHLKANITYISIHIKTYNIHLGRIMTSFLIVPSNPVELSVELSFNQTSQTLTNTKLMAGIEPATPSLPRTYSTPEPHQQLLIFLLP